MSDDAMNIAMEAASAAKEKKATRVVILDMGEQADLCQTKLICSGSNDKQTQAIANAIQERCKKTLKIKPIATEGTNSGHWIVLDYGDTICHIFFDYVRDFYSLEQLWPKAKFIKP